uniref:Integrin, alpha 5 (fibronectin receptor, alpha polypeptide) n=1 Tax=Takifugu rubripes TaxID=31033 RepID=A0A674NUF9_TAKRU
FGSFIITSPFPAPGTVAPLSRSFLCIMLLLTSSLTICEAFNLDLESPTVYSGPAGSYFGYSVDFYLVNTPSASVVIGAPKAKTRQVNIKEGGSVFYCPWSLSQTDCHAIEFDTKGDRTTLLNNTEVQVDFKSHQWFGATVRTHGDTILACAPLYSWRTEKDIPYVDPTGTCYLSTQNFTKFVEYAPCRTEISDAVGQGYCQGGFSADFTKDGKVVLGGPGSYFWQGQIISAAKEDIIRTYYPGYFMQSVDNQIQTKQVRAAHDDSYQGYSVAVGEFSGDGTEDFVAGVPKGLKLYGLVSILNGRDLKTLINYTGEQMGSYFGYAVATTDVNGDGMTDLLVGAPMFMVRGSDSRLEEMGRVYTYLQRGPLNLELRPSHLTGTQVFGRYGSTIAPLGDLNQDGFNDVAISCPFGGEEQQGLVYIYNGYSEGLSEKPSQVIAGQWAAGSIPSSFGFALRGAKDLDMNGYPDLMVGAFGVNKAVLYRSRPIVTAKASLTIYPNMINPEEKNCMITSGNTSIPVSCVNLSFCISADGKHLPDVEVQLDSQKHKQKGAVKRALFLDSQQPLLQRSLAVRRGENVCKHTKLYLRDEKEFRDKLSSIYVALNFSLDPEAPADSHGLRPILNYQIANVKEQKAQILLDCGEDNICVPDLKLAVQGKEVYLGDDNALTLTFNARNEGEGGAYEAELYVVLPPEADYSGIARNNELTCSYDTENQTRYLSCDLGNPMKSGTSVWAGLRFTVPRLKDTHKTVQFELQIRSKNENNSHSEVVPYMLEVVVQADVILQGLTALPLNECVLEVKSESIIRVFPNSADTFSHFLIKLVNNGPSGISQTVLELRCPLSTQGQTVLYPLEFSTQGPINCTSDSNMNHLGLKVSLHTASLAWSCSNSDCWTLRCNVGLLERGTTAILKVRSRVWAETFVEQYVLECLAGYSVRKMPYLILPKYYPSGEEKVVTPLLWNKPDLENSVPLWIIILAILAGLLLLALLIYVLYKIGFFKRSVPYDMAMEKAQIKPVSEA